MQASFPRPVRLTVRKDNWCTTLHFGAGLNEVPDSLVNHWWLKVNGVTATQQKIARAPAPQPETKFKYLHSLADEIAKLGDIGAEAKELIDNDLGDLRVQKAKVFEQLRRVLSDKRDAVQALAAKLEPISGAKTRE